MAYNLDLMSQQLQDLQRQIQSNNNFQLYQPQANVPQIQQVQPPIITRQVQYVEGLGGAKLYQQNLPSNSSEIIMDKDENLFYMVSKDANGTPSKKIPVGRFTIEETIDEESPFLTRKDFDDFKEEIRQMFAASKASAPVTSTPKATSQKTTTTSKS